MNEFCHKKCGWGGKREQAGRKRTCLSKVPFNRRINENILNILKKYASEHNITDTEALENAILLQNNIYKLQGDKNMIICIPTKDGKLCAHFGNCESFTFAEVNPETKEIINIEENIPEDGISCQSASWIAQKGANIVLAGGMGGRPQNIFAQAGLKIIAGCPELPTKEIVEKYLSNTLEAGVNTCSGDHHDCHAHHSLLHRCHH